VNNCGGAIEIDQTPADSNENKVTNDESSAFTSLALRADLSVSVVGGLESDGTAYGVDKGQVWLLPSVVWASVFHPISAVILLEIALPE
jgi:hypothetical protein